jgi:multicomponent Na+:H+ antiporter subunit D
VSADWLVPYAVVVPLVGAALCILAHRIRWIQRLVSLAVLSSALAVAITLLVRSDRDGYVVTQASGWDAPIGITLAVDRLSALLLTLAVSMLLVALVYAIGERGVEADHDAFHPAYLVLAAGISASFVTGDLFNLFVAFEMMLAASYVLIALGGRPEQIRAGMTYVVMSLVASTLFITALAMVYASTGTVNMADLARRVPELSNGMQTGLALLLLIVFGMKAAIFPLFFWLPDSYPAAPAPIMALFAGLLTKVGIYAIVRTQTLIFPDVGRQGALLLVLAGLTMMIGVLGALAQDDLRRTMSFHVIGQIGYLLLGLGLFSVAGIAGVVFYIVQTILVKTNMFLAVDLVGRRGGSNRLSELGGLARTAPALAFAFALPALSLAGLPPSSGFAGKFSLIGAGVDARQWAIVVVALVAGALTLLSMTKVWAGAFWGDRPATATDAAGTDAPPAIGVLTAGATGVVVALSIAYVVFAGPIYDFSQRAAEQLLDPVGYVRAVLGGAS